MSSTLALAKEELESNLAELERQVAEGQGVSDSCLLEVESALKSAELEVRTLSGSSKETERTWLRQKKGRVEELKKQSLLASKSAKADNSSAARARQEKLTARMQAQNETLEAAKKSIEESEQTATGIMLGLAAQRETIKSTSKKVEQVNEDLGYSSQLLKSMKSWWTFSSIQDKGNQ